jgi:hypothetical protein
MAARLRLGQQAFSIQVYHYIRDLAYTYHASMEAQAFLDLALPGFTLSDADEYSSISGASNILATVSCLYFHKVYFVGRKDIVFVSLSQIISSLYFPVYSFCWLYGRSL